MNDDTRPSWRTIFHACFITRRLKIDSAAPVHLEFSLHPQIQITSLLGAHPKSVPLMTNEKPRSRDWSEYLLAWTLFTMASFCWLMIGLSYSGKSWDFPQFYIAGNLPSSLTYNREAVVNFGRSHLATEGITYYPPYVRPSAFSLPLKIFRGRPYWEAFWIWAAAGFVAYSIAIHLLVRTLSLPLFLVPVFGFFSAAQFGTSTGQDITVYLLVFFLGALMLSRNRNRFWTGVLFSLCLYKFNLVFLVPLLLVRHRLWSTLLGFSFGAASIGLVSFSTAPLSEYIETIALIPNYSKDMNYWGLHGIVDQLNLPIHIYYVGVVCTLAVCARLIWRTSLFDAISVCILGSLLSAYHVMWYDSTMLAIPVAVIWHRASLVSRGVLLLILLAPPASVFGTPIFYVSMELFVLCLFARTLRGVALPSSVAAGHSYL